MEYKPLFKYRFYDIHYHVLDNPIKERKCHYDALFRFCFCFCFDMPYYLSLKGAALSGAPSGYSESQTHHTPAVPLTFHGQALA